jgi:hypothetical protein
MILCRLFGHKIDMHVLEDRIRNDRISRTTSRLFILDKYMYIVYCVRCGRPILYNHLKKVGGKKDYLTEYH